MPLYVDSSALVKLYLIETDSAAAQTVLFGDDEWVTAAHAEVEVRRVLAVRLRAAPELHRAAREQFAADWQRTSIVALDTVTCRLAADLAETTLARSLDALHLAAAQRAGAPALPFVTYDLRLAQAARSLGWPVLGA